MAREDAAALPVWQGTLQNQRSRRPLFLFFLYRRVPDADTFLFFCIKPLSGQNPACALKSVIACNLLLNTELCGNLQRMLREEIHLKNLSDPKVVYDRHPLSICL